MIWCAQGSTCVPYANAVWGCDQLSSQPLNASTAVKKLAQAWTALEHESQTEMESFVRSGTEEFEEPFGSRLDEIVKAFKGVNGIEEDGLVLMARNLCVLCKMIAASSEAINIGEDVRAPRNRTDILQIYKTSLSQMRRMLSTNSEEERDLIRDVLTKLSGAKYSHAKKGMGPYLNEEVTARDSRKAYESLVRPGQEHEGQDIKGWPRLDHKKEEIWNAYSNRALGLSKLHARLLSERSRDFLANLDANVSRRRMKTKRSGRRKANYVKKKIRKVKDIRQVVRKKVPEMPEGMRGPLGRRCRDIEKEWADYSVVIQAARALATVDETSHASRVYELRLPPLPNPPGTQYTATQFSARAASQASALGGIGSISASDMESHSVVDDNAGAMEPPDVASQFTQQTFTARISANTHSILAKWKHWSLTANDAKSDVADTQWETEGLNVIERGSNLIQQSIVHVASKVCTPDKVTQWLNSTELVILDDLCQSFALLVYCAIDFSDDYVVSLAAHTREECPSVVTNIWEALHDVSVQLGAPNADQFAFSVLGHATGYNFMRGVAVLLEAYPQFAETAAKVHTGDWADWRSRFQITKARRPAPMEELVGHIRKHSVKRSFPSLQSLHTLCSAWDRYQREYFKIERPLTISYEAWVRHKMNASICWEFSRKSPRVVLRHDNEKNRGKVLYYFVEDTTLQHMPLTLFGSLTRICGSWLELILFLRECDTEESVSSVRDQFKNILANTSGAILGMSRMRSYWLIKRGPRFFYAQIQSWFATRRDAVATILGRWVLANWMQVEARSPNHLVKQRVTNLWVAFAKLDRVLYKSNKKRLSLFGLLASGMDFTMEVWENWMGFLQHVDEQTVHARQSMDLLPRDATQTLRLPGEDEHAGEMYYVLLEAWEGVKWETMAEAYSCLDPVIECGKVLIFTRPTSSSDSPETVMAQGRKLIQPRDYHRVNPTKYKQLFHIYRERMADGRLHPYRTRLLVALQANALEMGLNENDDEDSSSDSSADLVITQGQRKRVLVGSEESSGWEDAFTHGFDEDDDSDWEMPGPTMLRKRKKPEGGTSGKAKKRRRKK